MTKERTSNERFEIVGLTKAEVDRCMEVLCGGPVEWDRGYCFASAELFARPCRYGPTEASRRLWKPASSDEPSTGNSPDIARKLEEIRERARAQGWGDIGTSPLEDREFLLSYIYRLENQERPAQPPGASLIGQDRGERIAKAVDESRISGWVVEGGWSPTSEPDYWVGSSAWSADPYKALKFVTKEDATQAADLMCAGLNVRIAEHEWSRPTKGESQ